MSVPLLSIQFCAPRALRSNLGWGLGSTRRSTTCMLGVGGNRGTARRTPGGGLPATSGDVYGGKAPGSRGWAAACQRHADPSPGTRVGGTYPRTPQGSSWIPPQLPPAPATSRPAPARGISLTIRSGPGTSTTGLARPAPARSKRRRPEKGEEGPSPKVTLDPSGSVMPCLVLLQLALQQALHLPTQLIHRA